MYQAITCLHYKYNNLSKNDNKEMQKSDVII